MHDGSSHSEQVTIYFTCPLVLSSREQLIATPPPPLLSPPFSPSPFPLSSSSLSFPSLSFPSLSSPSPYPLPSLLPFPFSSLLLFPVLPFLFLFLPLTPSPSSPCPFPAIFLILFNNLELSYHFNQHPQRTHADKREHHSTPRAAQQPPDPL